MDVSYTRREHLADSCIHSLGVTAGIAGALWLMAIALPTGNWRLETALGLYGTGLVLMLCFSAAYNLTRDPVRREQLRRCDHAAIFVMIAGTYSPLMLVTLAPEDGLRIFTLVWIAALCGVVLKFRWPRRFEGLGIAAYLALGWTFLECWKPLEAVLPPEALWLLAAGGALYTAGVGFHLAQRLPFHNALWHAFVLAAATCHYTVILRYVALAAVG